MKIEKRVEKINKIRSQGFVPGVLYGKTINSTSIQAEYKELFETYKAYGKSKTFKIKLDNKNHLVYLKDIELDTFKPNNIIHFSLLKVSASDTMTAEIAVHAVGKDHIEKQGLILQIMPTLTVEFPADAGINNIDVDVTKLAVGDAICAKDIVLPEAFKLHLEPETIVANVSYSKVAEAEEKAETTEEKEDSDNNATE